MTAISGEVLETFELSDGAGEDFPIQIVRPTPDAEQMRALREASDRWLDIARDFVRRADADQVERDVARRAVFGSEVLFFAASQLRNEDRAGVLIATSEGDPVGAALYFVRGDVGTLAWVAVHPLFLAGSPLELSQAVRGIGSSLTCVAAQQMAAAGATTIRLSALDDAAEAFWRSRGFEDCGGDELCVRGAGVAELAAACRREPDDQAQGDVVLCGTYESTAACRVPDLREVMV